MADNALHTAFDPAAPAAEAYDAHVDLMKSVAGSVGTAMPASDLQELAALAMEAYEEEALEKAASIIPFPGLDRIPSRQRGMKSVFIDNLQTIQQGDYYEKPSPIDFDGLRDLVEQTPILNGMLMTRTRQISRFCNPSDNKGPGFSVVHKDKDYKLTPADSDAIGLLTKFFQNCGWEFNPRLRKAMRRDNFTQFMARLQRDSFTLDSAPIETEMKRQKGLGIDGLYAVDGATIRLCTDEGYEGDDAYYALQVVQRRIVTAYTYDSLIYEVRNPRTDVTLAGYGQSETEMLVRIVTGILNAMTYNNDGFDKNSIPKGILNIIGDYDKKDIAAFKRMWAMQTKGVANRWNMPVMFSKEKDACSTFERIDTEFNEMHFAKWMTFLGSLACSVYGFSPEEINIESFSSGSSSALSGSDTSEKLASSKDNGLRPNLAYWEGVFTDFVVSAFDDRLAFRWSGLDDIDQAQMFEKQKLCLTANEMRKDIGYDPMPGKIGDAPLNPSLMGAWQQENMPPPEPPAAPEQEQPDFGNAADEPKPDGSSPPPDAGGAKPPEGGDDFGKPPGAAPPKGGGADFGKAFEASIFQAVEPYAIEA